MIMIVVVGMCMAIRTGGVRTHSTTGFAVISAAVRSVLDLDCVVLDGEPNLLSQG